MDCSSLNEVSTLAHDLSNFICDVENSYFAGSLPPVLVSDHLSIAADSPTKKQKNKSSTENISISNLNKKPEWQIGKKLCVGEVFNKEATACVPGLKPGLSCCARCASKGYCFDDCSLKESHYDWPPAVQ